jgi:hypothetical protein
VEKAAKNCGLFQFCIHLVHFSGSGFMYPEKSGNPRRTEEYEKNVAKIPITILKTMRTASLTIQSHFYSFVFAQP